MLLPSTDFVASSAATVTLEQSWPCAPPRASCLLLWLSVPTVGEDFVTDLGSSNVCHTNGSAHTVVHVPSASELPHFRVALPGCQEAVLLSATITTRRCVLPSNVARLHTTVTISDASGSTGMTASSTNIGAGGHNGETVRDRFNALSIRRFLNHLRAVPASASSPHQLLQGVYLRVHYAWYSK